MKAKIYWDKKYYEDLGTKDKDGFYDYAYYYYDYWFNLPNNEAIRFRKYLDTPEKCSIFGIYKKQNTYKLGKGWEIVTKLSKNMIYSNKYLSAIVEFMINKQNIKQIFVLDEKYKQIEIEKINKADFVFEQKKIIE